MGKGVGWKSKLRVTPLVPPRFISLSIQKLKKPGRPDLALVLRALRGVHQHGAWAGWAGARAAP